MSVTTLGFSETAYHDEGVLITRSADGFLVKLPRPTSASHRLRIIAVLWRVWVESRNELSDRGTEWTVGVSQADELTIPLAAIVRAINAELAQAGRKLVVVGGMGAPPLGLSTT